MKQLSRPFASVSLVLIVVGPVLAAAPTAAFLTPSKYTASIGEAVNVRFDVGAAKDARPGAWPAEGVRWLFVRGGPAQENRHDVRPARDSDNFTSATIEHPGVTLVGTDQVPAVTEAPAAEWRAFLTLNAADPAKVSAGLTDRPVRVRQVISTKTLIRAAADNQRITPSAIATSKSGQVVEIRVHFDPTAAQPGSDIPLTFYVDGDKRSDAKVQATNVTTGKSEEFVTDGGGSGHFCVTDAGVWRVEGHYVQALDNDPSADWVVYTATLTFEVGAPVAKGGAQ
ncbi:MAG: hypothetical protein KA383_03150 [Phycisphaerae bacterium]|nr:hypothetical protein [Phycisphaerae bacterium]